MSPRRRRPRPMPRGRGRAKRGEPRSRRRSSTWTIASGAIARQRAGAPREQADGRAGHGRDAIMKVFVRDNDINAALRVLKKKLQREGMFREMKRRRSYEKPSERRAREAAEAVRRHRKAMRKRMEREGY